MNKHNKSRKLALDTETLLPLQADDINQVHGGQATVVSLPTLTRTLTTTTTTTTSSLPTTSRLSWNGGGQ